MERVTQLHHVSKEELFDMLLGIEKKLDQLQRSYTKPKIYSVKELAKYCGVAELTVRNWITEGKIKAKTIGRRIFIEEEEFQKALSEVRSLKYQRV